MAKFWFIRHGQSEVQLHPELIGGRSPEAPLTPLGISQAQTLGKCLESDSRLPRGFDQTWVSTLIRTQMTFDHIRIGGEKNALPCPHHDSRLIELDQGDWVGKPRDKVYNEYIMDLIAEDTLHFKAPDGESQFEVTVRMLSWFDQALKYTHNAQKKKKSDELNVAVIGHGIATKVLLCNLFGISNLSSFRISIDNCSISIVDVKGDLSNGTIGDIEFRLDCVNFVYPQVRDVK